MAETGVRKKGLGKGLSHLFGEAEAAYRIASDPAQPGAIHDGPGARTLPVAFLRPGRFQPRRHFDDAALDELAASIRNHGMIQPILVRPLEGLADNYEIIAGERRWRAAQKAELHDVPVIVQTLTDAQALEIALIENLQRQDLTALEEAEGYQRLIDEFKHSHGALAELLGKSRSHVANTLRLLALPAGVKSLVADGTLSAGHARALLTAPDPDALAKTVADRGLSVRDTERLVNLAKASPKAAAKPMLVKGGRKHADLLALERDLTDKLGLRVSIETQGLGGGLTITYRTIDQLDQIIEKLSN